MARPRKQKSPSAAPEARRCVIYARVSSKEQEEGYSIDSQLRYLTAYASSKGLVTAAVFIEAETAKKSGRTEFGNMLRFVASGGVEAIVVEKTDRLYRNLADRVKVDELGVQLHLVKENTVLSRDSRSHEKFIHDIKVVVAKNYVDNLAEETKKGMREKAQQGIWPSVAPIGYRNVSVGAKRVIEPDPDEAAVVRKLFELYASGEYSVRRAGAAAASLGLKSRKGKRLASATVYVILRNPIYYGLVAWNGEEYPGVHEPLVTKATWDKVQRVLEGRQHNLAGGGSGPGDIFIYRGMFTCGRCGCAITAERKKGKYIYYTCTGSRGCPRIACGEAEITEQICAALDRLTIRPATMAVLRHALKESFAEQRDAHAEVVARLRAEHTRLKDRLEQLYLDKLAGEVPVSVYQKLRGEWEADVARIEESMGQAERANRATWEDSVQMLELVSNSAARFRTASTEVKREMLRNLVSNSQLIDGKVHLEMRGWFKSVVLANLRIEREGVSETELENWLPAMDSNHD